ncbi:hypothetical protein [Flammeovirga kamogawensis]|uniref:Uncharacterized protein n=1 Tax=Flammeovirga kamogawensis TaxID=373891 RepID=A0ABX8H0U6_9BACT|nr:hypothetical protein [Flammeovirga kamogawensis]MBB6459375.1 hypothetical protein [Flammeovirga kamogawensis]QWG08932.1 hypothetical protein KM029_08305 [Flammeovirga kamogawensis]TRX67223.1 hypothetical protein EO216_03355 [Flammeovirga kamogawensis]
MSVKKTNLKPTKGLQVKLEDLFAETDFNLRYEKGSFKSGYCLIKNAKVAIINKYYSQEGKIQSMIDILKEIDVDISQLSEKNITLYETVTAEDFSI